MQNVNWWGEGAVVESLQCLSQVFFLRITSKLFVEFVFDLKRSINNNSNQVKGYHFQSLDLIWPNLWDAQIVMSFIKF